MDILIDEKLRPWLLEVNHSPSFNCDSDLDKDIKKTVVADTMKILNLTSEKKAKAKKARLENLQNRMAGTQKRANFEKRK